jgi:rare lipoprotein A
VVVVVDDRGPFVRGRVIDLSLAAARRLGMVRDGVVPVRLEVIG